MLLNIAIFLPLAGIPFVLMLKGKAAKNWAALITTSVTFLVSVPLMLNFDVANSSTLQYMTVGQQIFDGFDVKYLVGLDGLSLLLFMLTTFMGPIVILSSWDSVKKHISGYLSMLLLLQTASLGVFASLDLIVFYIFFELSLIPMYFLIGIWGGADRIRATIKFFIYTLVGSLIMLVALLYVGYDAGSFMQGVSFSTDWRFMSVTMPAVLCKGYHSQPIGAFCPGPSIKLDWYNRPISFWHLPWPFASKYRCFLFTHGFLMPTPKLPRQDLWYWQPSC